MTKPTTFDDLYPGRFLKCGLLHGRNVTLTIRSVTREALIDDTGKENLKATLYFTETQMGLVLCKTNGLLIREMLGTQLSAWEGKRITLGPDKWNGEDCIRVMGSPDLPADKQVQISLPRRKPFTRRLTKTQPAQPTQTAQREPGEEG